MKVMGIDPGLRELGWAVVSITTKNRSNGKKRKINICGKVPEVKIVSWGVISTLEEGSTSTKLYTIGKRINSILRKYQPKIVGIETPFVWKNPDSALKLGMVVGLCVEVARKYKTQVKLVAPILAKSKITGFQFASKEDVKKAIISAIKNKSKFMGREDEIPYHIWDAMSIAISSVSGINP